MRRFNDFLKLLKAVRLNSAILVLLVVVFGAFLAPTESSAQAVPPRVQSLMINRPIVVPPTPPLQKEIEKLRREVRARPQASTAPPLVFNVTETADIRSLQNQIKKMEYQITVLEAELGRLRQELRRRR
ncbi:MAG: hypothetical protein ACLP5H_02865 [Desulfomonilaceae bacterium]